MLREMKQRFSELFGEEGDIRAYFAPGRVNLIGEHTDYNGGHVFPCALTLGIYGLARKREDRKLRFYSMNLSRGGAGGIVESSLDDLVLKNEDGWANYPKGVVWTFDKRGFKPDKGFDFMVSGNIPGGAGLSSSAALEVLTGIMLRDLYGFGELSLPDLARIGQYSENNFNGMNCGIMDQFASAMGKKNCAIFLDTNTLAFEHVPVVLKDARIVITNSKVKHSLVNSAYNERRAQCEAALADLQKVVSINALGELTCEQFEEYRSAIQDPVCVRRAKHAVYENQRTIESVAALKKGDIATFGALINASHVSLRDDYETSCPECDLLAELAWAHPGVLGSRITGGGFGGCTVSIVKNDAVDSFIEEIGREYKKQVGKDPEFYQADVGEGAHKI